MRSNVKKIILTIVILFIIAGAGLAVYYNNAKRAMAPSDADLQNLQKDIGQNQSSQNPASTSSLGNLNQNGGQNSATSTQSAGRSTGTFSAGEGDTGPDIQVFEVSYDGSRFAPNPANIKVNDYVIFKNNSSQDFWPASDPYPTDTDYPDFDAKKAIAPGGKYQFQFTKIGNWGFHDHLNPSVKGVIMVTK